MTHHCLPSGHAHHNRNTIKNPAEIKSEPESNYDSNSSSNSNNNNNDNKVKKIVGKICGHGQDRKHHHHHPHLHGQKSPGSLPITPCMRLTKGNRRQTQDANDSKQISIDLWNTAYDALRKDGRSLALVQAYECIISQELPNEYKQGMNTSLSQHPPSRRLELMDMIAKSGVKKGLGSKGSQVHDSARKMVDFAKETIGSLIPAWPSASVAWAGFCALTPLLIDPLLEQEEIKESLMFVLARLSMFMPLSLFLNSSNWKDAEDFRNLHDSTRRAIIELYQNLLELEMNCICAAGSAWNSAAKNVVDWKGWGSRLAIICELEDLIAQDIMKYGTQKAQENLLEAPKDMDNVLAAEPGKSNHGSISSA